VVWGHAAFPKGKAVGEVLRQLEAKEKVSSLVGRPYIRQALNALRSCVFRNGIREASTRNLLCNQGRDSEEGSEVVSRLSFEFHSQERRYPPLAEIQKAYLNAPQRTTLVTKAYLHTL
jgi:hypothetical protein